MRSRVIDDNTGYQLLGTSEIRAFSVGGAINLDYMTSTVVFTRYRS
jgi:hypothetical protein